MKPSEMASLSNSRKQNRKKRPNRIRDMVERDILYVVREGMSE